MGHKAFLRDGRPAVQAAKTDHAPPGSPLQLLNLGLVLITPLMVWLVLWGGSTLMEAVHLSFDSDTIVNPGFETRLAGGNPSGYLLSGPTEAFRLDPDGHSGQNRLTEVGVGEPVEARQTVRGLQPGWYTLRAWVRSSDGQPAGYLRLVDCGGPEQRANVPVAPPDQWLQIVLSVQVTGNQCTVGLDSQAGPQDWVSFDDLEFTPGRAALTVMGADVSSLKKSEDLGGVYKDENGVPGDALQILQAHGLNAIRLRVWVNPPDGYHDKAELLVMARRAHDLGIKLLVDFHYSDTWADPGKQTKPAAWENLNFEALKQALYDHTYDVCHSLVAQGTPPDMVQIGNEINNGMVWPDGRIDRWDDLAALLKSGYQAVKDCSPATRVMLHLAEGGKNDEDRWWLDNAIQRGVPFDLIGVSYYPYWHGTLADLQQNLDDLTARYNKDVIVVETAYPFTSKEHDFQANIIKNQMVPGYPLTPQGQARMLADVMAIVRAVPGGRGLGVFYWDATWTAVTGNGWDPAQPLSGDAWENQALFDYDDRALPAMRLFAEP